MISLNLPKYEFRFQKEEDSVKIFDEIRKKFVVLQPEEWVRQHWIQYLIQEKNYPASLLKVERSVNTKLLKQRSDIVAYNTTGKPILIVECKAPNIKITQEAFEQIARYNMKLQVPFLAVSNGLQHFCCKVNYTAQDYQFLQEIPDFQSL